jgi:LAO/AO transport system kinase
MADARELGERLIRGDVRALARACRIVDDRLPGYRELLSSVHAKSSGGWVVGVTGSGGVGKSSLVDCLITRFRADGERVGVVAIDPSSSIHGGALLGDRIRMQRHYRDPDVFIRSVATRGSVGGLSRSVAQVTRLLCAWGASVVLLETVGVGQDELDVAKLAHTTLVVVAPGLGDGVQAMKAGVLEIADLFAVNKADQPAASRATSDLEVALELRGASLGASSDGWSIPVIKTSVTESTGLDELKSALLRHRAWLETAPGLARTAARRREGLLKELEVELLAALDERLGPELRSWAERIDRGEAEPGEALEALLARWAPPSLSEPKSS